MTAEKIPSPQYLFIEVDGISFFLGDHRFFLSPDDALKFGAGLVNAALEQKSIIIPQSS